MSNNRYVLPSITEKTSYGVKTLDPYTKLFEERIIFLGTPIDDTVANDIMSQLLTLEAMDPERDITIYINSPGGSFTAMTAIYDTMEFIRPKVSTVCLGQAASAAAVLLSAGAPGRRYALKNSRILLHQPSSQGEGQGSDIEIQANEIERIKDLQLHILESHTGKPAQLLEEKMLRDLILTPQAAKELGVIDEVLASRKL